MTPRPEGPLRDRFRGTLLGVAVGDAVGAGFEGAYSVPPDELEDELEGDRSLSYTDDTHMSIGVAESLVERKGFDGEAMAARFVADHEREPWRGYGPGPPRVFDLIRRGVPWKEAGRRLFDGSGSFGNGAAMRAAPVALFSFPDVELAADLARRQAVITHAHPLGVEGAALQAAAVCLVLRHPPGEALYPSAVLGPLGAQVSESTYREKIEAVGSLLVGAADRGEVVARLGNGIEAPESVPTALYCFLRHAGSFAETVRFAVGLGGDTDTIASMAGALAGALLGESGIPELWRRRLEGTERLRGLADALYDVRGTRP